MFPSVERIAFIELCTVDRDAYRTAVLVTDALTDPLEFRCTSPVRPNRMQKLLWGSRLTRQLVTRVLGKPLLDALEPPPGLVVVRQKPLLELRTLVSCPVVQLVWKAEDAGCRLLVENPPSMPGKTNADGEAVYLRAWDNNDADLRLARALLEPLAAQVNLNEPFVRVLQALTVVHQQESQASST